MDLMRTEEDEEGGEEDGKGREVGLLSVYISFSNSDLIKSAHILGKPPRQDYHCWQGCISCGPCSYPELTEDHVLPSA